MLKVNDCIAYLKTATVKSVNKLLILGYGNPSRGDDGLGPELIQQLEQLKSQNHWPDIELLSEYQLQIENILDIQNHDLVLLIDAHISCAAPYEIDHCYASHDLSYSSHALSPAALLFIYQQTLGIAPPPCYVLNIRGYQFELGRPMTPFAKSNLQAAGKFAQQFCHHTNIGDAQNYLENHLQSKQYA